MDIYIHKMAKKTGSLVTNVLKWVYGWQNDGQQKELFYEDSDETMCPVWCGQVESRMHLIQYTATHLQSSHVKRREEFKQAHTQIRTTKVIHEAFVCIFSLLLRGDTPPFDITYFASNIEKIVQKAWTNQRAIGWDQVLKGRISKYWGAWLVLPPLFSHKK